MPNVFEFVGTGPLLIILLLVVIALLASFVASRYRVANANEALIVAGSRGSRVRDDQGQPIETGHDDKGIRVVVGGGTLVLPLVHKVGRLKLTARQIAVQLPDAVTSQGIKVAVQGVATFKIGRDVDSIRNAAERFLDAKDEQIDSIVKNVLEGSLRAIVGTLTIEELIMDRQKLLQQVADSAKGDLATSGLQIDAFTIQSINDESGYVDLMGQQKLSLVARDARMAKAAADQQAAVREAEAEQVTIQAQRDVALRRAEIETQTAAANARASQAGPLAQAEAQQDVVRKQTELAGLEASRRQQELVASTIRPAEAEAEAIVRRAEGDKQARIAQAQADAERVKLAGQAEAWVSVTKGEALAKVVLVNAQAESERTTLEGNAEAGIVFTKGEAEAKALALRAEAYKQFNEAAIIQTVLGMLPEIVRAAAEPMASIDQLTVMSTDGATEVVRSATRTVAEASTVVKGLTGLDVPVLINRAMGRNGNGDGNGHGDDRGAEGGAIRRGGSTAGATAAGRSRGSRRGPGGGGGGTGGAAGGGDGGGDGGPGGTGDGSGAVGSSARSADPSADSSAGSAVVGTGDTGAAEHTEGGGPVDPQARVEAAMRAATDSMDRASHSMAEPLGRGVLGETIRREGTSAARATAADLGITTDTPLSQAAAILARQLRRVPGAENHAALRLIELDTRGPQAMRAVWRLTKPRLAARYGSMTIEDLLTRYPEGMGPWRVIDGSGPTTAPPAS